jgi:tetratricopeptide (TPR) repeat protein
VEADPDNVIPAAREALQHALENGPDLAETQLALSTYHYFLRQDLDAAEVAARRAVELGRNSALSHMFLGLLLAEKGQYVEARAMLQKARNLDPRFPLIFANSALVELWANEPAAAYELGTQAVAINPEFWVGYLHRGTAQVALGDYDGALQSFAKAEKLSGNNSARAASSRAYVLSLLGRDEEVREILINLLETATHRKINSYYMAIVYAALDENDKALEWLNEGVVQNNLYCRDMEIDRMLDNLRSDLRLEKLIVNCKRALEHPPPESELSLIL